MSNKADFIESEFKNYDGKINYAEIARAYERIKREFLEIGCDDLFSADESNDDEFLLWLFEGLFPLEKDIAMRMVYELIGEKILPQPGMTAYRKTMNV